MPVYRSYQGAREKVLENLLSDAMRIPHEGLVLHLQHLTGRLEILEVLVAASHHVRPHPAGAHVRRALDKLIVSAFGHPPRDVPLVVRSSQAHLCGPEVREFLIGQHIVRLDERIGHVTSIPIDVNNFRVGKGVEDKLGSQAQKQLLGLGRSPLRTT